MNATDVVVIGAGPAGLAAAIATAHSGVDVTLAAPRASIAERRKDTRTTALLTPSADFLDNIGLRHKLDHVSTPLTGIRLIDASGGLIKAPEVLFKASELGRESFGFNIANGDLVASLASVALNHPRIQFVDTKSVTALRQEGDAVVATLHEGNTIAATVAIAADGRQSIGRALVGGKVETWTYPQSALAVTFGHTRDHQQISTEFHRPCGPLTTVPLPAAMAAQPPFEAPFASSVVWVEQPQDAERLLALNGDAFRAELSARLQGLLGTITAFGPRALFPLSAARLSTMAANRVALVGEAAHVLPPIGAQGLNLGLRDAAEIADQLGGARRQGTDIGTSSVLAAYDQARRADVATRMLVIDGFNRALLAEAGAFGAIPHAARAFGMMAMSNIAPLRRLTMHAGLEPVGGRPKLMRPQQNSEQTFERKP